MKTPDQLEEASAKRMRIAAINESMHNCMDKRDWDAAAMAILTRAIELITKKEVQICYKK